MRRWPALILALALLAACGGAPAAPAPTAAPAAPAEPPAADGVDRSRLSQEINLFNWTDYIDPQVLQDFEAEYGVRVRLDTFESNEALLAKIQAGATGYDIVVPSDYMVDIMVKQGMLAELDLANIPNISNIGMTYRDTWFDPGGKFCMPYMYGTTGIAYDSEVVTTPVESWGAIFEPDPSLSGKVSMLNDQREVINAALKYLGFSLNTTNPDELAKAQEVLVAQKPMLAFYASDGIIDRLASGEVVMAHTWPGAAFRAAEQRPSIRYVIPSEGGSLWQDNLCILKDAPNKYTAEVFLNYLARPEVAAKLTNFVQYATPNEAARPLLDEKLKDNPGLYPPPEVMAKMERSQDLGEGLRLWDRVWTEVKAGQ